MVVLAVEAESELHGVLKFPTQVPAMQNPVSLWMYPPTSFTATPLTTVFVLMPTWSGSVAKPPGWPVTLITAAPLPVLA